MAKSGAERQIAHIKDIFPASGSVRASGNSGRHTSNTKKTIDNGSFQTKQGAQPTNVHASTGDVFFQKANVSHSSYQDSRPQVVSGSNSVRIPSSRHKRAAPKPPDRQVVSATEDQPTKVQATLGSSDSVNGENNLSHAKTDSLRSPEATGHHLDKVVAKTSPRDGHEGGSTLHGGTPTHVVNGVNTGPRLSPVRAMSGPTYEEAKTNFTEGDGAQHRDMEQLGGSVESPPGDQEQHTCAASLLSDSGTTSNSSGYQSEDHPDPQRPSSGQYSISIGTVAPVSEQAEDEFDEEGFTLDFDEEEDTVVEGQSTLLYKEYQGEDFAHYLKDDADQGIADMEPPAMSTMPTAKHRNKDSFLSGSDRSTGVKSRKQRFKDKFGQMFVTPKPLARPSDRNHNAKIQTFSFADSKMGVILDNNGSPNNERSEQDYKDVGLPKSCWNTDTLSARSLQGSSNRLTRKKRSSSVPDLLDTDYPDPNSHAYGQRDFESYRKSTMYDSRGSSTSKKKGGLWSRLTRTLRKRDVLAAQQDDNTAINPLASDRARSTSTSDVAL